MRYSAVIIANPVAKRFSVSGLDKATSLLCSEGYRIEVKRTSYKGEAEKIARDAASKGIPLVIAAGGDGTFNEVINGIAMTGTAMGIIPMGTTNVLAKELGIEEDIDGSIKRIINGRVYLLSIGLITLQSPPLSRYFCLMAGIGFDGEAVFGCLDPLKRSLGKGAYILSGLKTLIGFKPEPLTFSFDSEIRVGYSAIIGKASKYGGHFKVTPDASLFKSDLYIYLMHGRRRLDILRYFIAILSGRHRGLKDITYSRVREVAVEGRAKVQIDGDYIGCTPAIIRVIPDAVRMVF